MSKDSEPGCKVLYSEEWEGGGMTLVIQKVPRKQQELEILQNENTFSWTLSLSDTKHCRIPSVRIWRPGSYTSPGVKSGVPHFTSGGGGKKGHLTYEYSS